MRCTNERPVAKRGRRSQRDREATQRHAASVQNQLELSIRSEISTGCEEPTTYRRQSIGSISVLSDDHAPLRSHLLDNESDSDETSGALSDRAGPNQPGNVIDIDAILQTYSQSSKASAEPSLPLISHLANLDFLNYRSDGELIQILHDSGLDRESRAQLFSQMFSSLSYLGFAGAILEPLLQIIEDSCPGTSNSRPPVTALFPEAVLCMLAVGVELNLTDTVKHLQRDGGCLLLDSLRIETLKRTPLLAWKSKDFHISQAISLVIFSQTWCLEKSLLQVAKIWNSLASIIVGDVLQNQMPPSIQTARIIHL